MANAPQISASISPNLVTTTDGENLVAILSVPFHASTGGQSITFDVVGYDFNNNDVASAKVAVKVKSVSGVLSIVGTPVHLVPINAGSSSELITASLTASISGSNVVLSVIGVAGKTIKWIAYSNSGVEVLEDWMPVPTPLDGYVQTWSASNTRWEPNSTSFAIAGSLVGGDLSGTVSNANVIKLQNRSVSNASPSNGYVLTWNGGTNSWEPAIIGALVNLSGDVTGTLITNTVLTLTGVDNGFGTNAVHFTQKDTQALLQIAQKTIIGNGHDFSILGQDAKVGGSSYFGGSVTINRGLGSDTGNRNLDGNIFIISGGGFTRISSDNGAAGTSEAEFGPQYISLNTSGTITHTTQEVYLDTPKLYLGGVANTFPNTTSATAGSSGDVPSQVQGYITVNINGTDRKIPYYNA